MDKKDSDSKYLISGALSVIVTVTLIWLIFIPHPSKYASTLNLAGAAGAAPVETSGGGNGGTYASSEFGFSVDAPNGFIPDETHVNRNFGTGAPIPGVAFMVPQSYVLDTDLEPDSYISIESIPLKEACLPSSFIITDDPGADVEIGGATYRYARSTTSLNGNIYEESVYARGAHGKCFAIHESAHYIEGSGRSYDRQSLDSAAERMAETLVIR